MTLARTPASGDLSAEAARAEDVGKGPGLGLSVASGIVKDHGGWIDVSRRPGEGSVFTVWLPERGRA